MMIKYTAGDIALLPEIESLWQQLNRHHQCVSPHFGEAFAVRTFAQRCAVFHRQEIRAVRVDLAHIPETGTPVGYCVATRDKDDAGEIDSIFVEEAHRGAGIAHQLFTRSLAWLHAHKASPIRIAVVYGNERAFGFYARYGFYPRQTTLIQKPVDGERTKT